MASGVLLKGLLRQMTDGSAMPVEFPELYINDNKIMTI